jgi:chemotaxis protein histidine kinase CheA
VKTRPEYLQAKEALEAAMHSSTRATEVTDEASAARASEILVQAKGAKKAIDKNRLKAGDPYRASTKAIDTEFKEMASPIDGVIDRLTEEINAYEEKKREAEAEAVRQHEAQVREHERQQREAEEKARREAEERERAAKAAAAANEPPPPPPPPPPAPAPPPPPPPPPPRREKVVRHTSSGSVSTRIEWKFEVVDRAMVPKKYHLLDEVQIGKDVRAGEREIPGLRIYSVENTQARSSG